MSRSIRLALTLGDVGGIGPEVALQAAVQAPASVTPILIGSADVLRKECRRLGIPMPKKWSPRSKAPGLFYVDPDPNNKVDFAPGKIRVSASRAAVRWIETAVDGCLAGNFDGMVTAPICKEGLLKAGLDMPGHTEFIAERCGVTRFGMMLMGGPLRVFLVTRHVPLADVEAHLDEHSVTMACQLTHEALGWLQSKNDKIAVCGLNPHAGDGGAIGSAEMEWITPLLKKLSKTCPLTGPVPADTVFHYARRGDFGAVVAMYHDQGLAPLKMLAFDSGINLTLGLPIIRTSPDHGTAFDLAGKGQASPRSMLEALKLAAKLARRSNPWGSPR